MLKFSTLISEEWLICLSLCVCRLDKRVVNEQDSRKPPADTTRSVSISQQHQQPPADAVSGVSGEVGWW